MKIAAVTEIKICELQGTALNWAYHEVYYKKLIEQGQAVKSWVLERHSEVDGDYDRTECETTFYQILSTERFGITPKTGSNNDQWEASKGTVTVTGTGPIQAVQRLYIMNHFNLTDPGQTIQVPEQLI